MLPRFRLMPLCLRSLTGALLTLIAAGCLAAPSLGLSEIAGTSGDGPITVFYPTGETARPLALGSYTLNVARNAAPIRGNGRLVVISHGSGGAPWPHADLARALVEAGFVVALPEHQGDNYKDPQRPGPEAWRRRPEEVSRAIDALGREPRFAPLLKLDRVGAYGMSAGGHTVLSLAGGRWSPARLRTHCEAHIDDDFQACVGLTMQLTGGLFDGAKKTLALWAIRQRLNDATEYAHREPRIAAAVAGVPLAADFDPASLATPPIPLAIITARQDKWLNPRYHGEAVLAACASCERLADLPRGGHGALLSPLPGGLSGLIGELLADPPGFDRAALPEVDRRIARFFRQHLLDAGER